MLGEIPGSVLRHGRLRNWRPVCNTKAEMDRSIPSHPCAGHGGLLEGSLPNAAPICEDDGVGRYVGEVETRRAQTALAAVTYWGVAYHRVP